MLAVSSAAVAQDSTKCGRIPPPRQNDPIIVVDGQIVTNPGEFTALTSGSFVSRGAGAAFGIMSYNCASCEDRIKVGQRPEMSFFVEPVVQSVSTSTPVKVGDVIEAVNDQPITSSAGSTQFMYPAIGTNRLTVRRGRDRLVLNFTLPLPCPETTIHLSFSMQGRFQPDSATRIRIRGISKLSSGPVYVIDGVPVYAVDGVRSETPRPPAGRYGFALSCAPDCGQLTIPDGTTYYSYRVAPKVTAIRDDSPAAAIGLKVGDVIVKVDGHSILEDDGALALARSDKKESLRLIVLRDGKEIALLLQAAK